MNMRIGKDRLPAWDVMVKASIPWRYLLRCKRSF